MRVFIISGFILSPLNFYFVHEGVDKIAAIMVAKAEVVVVIASRSIIG